MNEATHKTHLVEAEDAHFGAMLGGSEAIGPYTQPSGGVDDPGIIRIVRGITRTLHHAGCRGSWLIIERGEIVGLCSYLRPPSDGRVQIGYGIAPDRRGRGIATRAVAAMLEAAERDPQINIIEAETSINNPASSAVLAKNGFLKHGERLDPDEGRVIQWATEIRPRTNSASATSTTTQRCEKPDASTLNPG